MASAIVSEKYDKIAATELINRIAQAIGDPGSIVGRRPGPSWGEGNEGYAEVAESVTRWSTRAVVAVLTEALTIEPCHITGMHEPDHHTQYICSEQLREA